MKTVNSIRNSHTEAHSMGRPKIMFSVSMTIFGTLGLFTRNISLSSGELALYRAILAAALILVYLALTKQKINLKSLRRDIPLLLASGAAMGINWILLFQAYRYTTISAATLSYYFAPVIVTVASPFLFREKLTAKQILCFCMSTLGLVMIIGIGNLKQGGSDLTGILFGLGAAVFYATVILLNKFIKNVAGIHRTLLQFFAAIIVLLRRHESGFPERNRMDKPADRGTPAYRHYLLHVLFIPEGSARTGDGNPELHRSIGSGHCLHADPWREHDHSTVHRWCADPWICIVE